MNIVMASENSPIAQKSKLGDKGIHSKCVQCWENLTFQELFKNISFQEGNECIHY